MVCRAFTVGEPWAQFVSEGGWYLQAAGAAFPLEAVGGGVRPWFCPDLKLCVGPCCRLWVRGVPQRGGRRLCH